MPRKATSSTRRTTKKQPDGPVIRPEVMGTLLLLLAGITLLSLFAPNQSPIIAAWLDFLRTLLGWGQYIFWLPLFLLALWFFKRYGSEDQAER